MQFVLSAATASASLVMVARKDFPVRTRAALCWCCHDVVTAHRRRVCSGQGITVLHADGAHSLPSTLQLRYVPISGLLDAKHVAIIDVLKKARAGQAQTRVIIFCNTVQSCRALGHFLDESSVDNVCLHGEMPADRRAAEYRRFVSQECSVLVCTDSAARGLHMDDVDHVILFDFPRTMTDFLHRSGRTARAGRRGVVTCFVGKRDTALADSVRRLAGTTASMLTGDGAGPRARVSGGGGAVSSQRGGARHGRGGARGAPRGAAVWDQSRRFGAFMRDDRRDGSDRPPKQRRSGFGSTPSKLEKTGRRASAPRGDGRRAASAASKPAVRGRSGPPADARQPDSRKDGASREWVDASRPRRDGDRSDSPRDSQPYRREGGASREWRDASRPRRDGDRSDSPRDSQPYRREGGASREWGDASKSRRDGNRSDSPRARSASGGGKPDRREGGASREWGDAPRPRRDGDRSDSPRDRQPDRRDGGASREWGDASKSRRDVHRSDSPRARSASGGGGKPDRREGGASREWGNASRSRRDGDRSDTRARSASGGSSASSDRGRGRAPDFRSRDSRSYVVCAGASHVCVHNSQPAVLSSCAVSGLADAVHRRRASVAVATSS